jgi:AbrB family looped-hinge helix DNA binding protein
METTLLSSKGQVIIPKVIRDHFHWRPGTRLTVEETQAGILLKPASTFPPTDLQSGLGCSGYQGTAKELEEMQAGIDDELKRQWGKGAGS